MPVFVITIASEDPTAPRSHVRVRVDTERTELVARAIMLTLPNARILGDQVVLVDQPPIASDARRLARDAHRSNEPSPAPEEPEEEVGSRVNRYERDWVL